MKTIATILISIIVAGTGCATYSTADNKSRAASLNAEGPALLDKKGTMVLSGSGFKPDTDVTLLFTTKDGVESDIGYALEPPPHADASGSWNTTWSYGRFVAKKLVDEGDFTLLATDEDFNPVTRTTIKFTK